MQWWLLNPWHIVAPGGVCRAVVRAEPQVAKTWEVYFSKHVWWVDSIVSKSRLSNQHDNRLPSWKWLVMCFYFCMKFRRTKKYIVVFASSSVGLRESFQAVRCKSEPWIIQRNLQSGDLYQRLKRNDGPCLAIGYLKRKLKRWPYNMLHSSSSSFPFENLDAA